TAEQKKSKRSIYRINDNFFRFWFQFIEPKKSWIEESPEKVLAEDIMSSLDDFASKTFEDICIEYVWNEHDYHKVGRWWYKEDEIDLVGLDEGEDRILLGECKWTNSEVDTYLLDSLKKKSKKVQWKNRDRKEEYVLFSKSGFTKDLREKFSKSNQLYLYSLEDMMKGFEPLS
ncbi:MAG: DUF234 domain-containing protein, partial [Candidatus Thermoplasmatota archaeon]